MKLAIWIFGICASWCAATDKIARHVILFHAHICCWPLGCLAFVVVACASTLFTLFRESRETKIICLFVSIWFCFVPIFVHLSLCTNERDVIFVASRARTHAVIKHFVICALIYYDIMNASIELCVNYSHKSECSHNWTHHFLVAIALHGLASNFLDRHNPQWRQHVHLSPTNDWREHEMCVLVHLALSTAFAVCPQSFHSPCLHRKTSAPYWFHFYLRQSILNQQFIGVRRKREYYLPSNDGSGCNEKRNKAKSIKNGIYD